jgi:hypothetical protein
VAAVLGIDAAWTERNAAPGFSALKPLEDTIDAIVAAWVGTTILENAAEPFGDEDSAIWIPKQTWTMVH